MTREEAIEMKTNDYCNYKLSLALKVAGFDYPCYFYYTKENAPDDCVWQTTSEEAPVDYNRRIYAGCSMPLLYQAQKWLREKHHISIRVSYIPYHKVWFADWLNLDSGEFDDTDATFDSYEEALADGIEFVLELIKEGE